MTIRFVFQKEYLGRRKEGRRTRREWRWAGIGRKGVREAEPFGFDVW